MAAGDITDTLLQLSDFSAIREIGTNINEARLLPYIREAQHIDMQNFLGEELYYAFLIDQTDTTDFGTAKYQNLWDGATYTPGSNTVYCHGLKLMLLYLSYSRFLKNHDLNVTSYGVRILSDGGLSEKDQRTQVMTKSREAYSTGLVYQKECARFIDDNSGDFPLYSPNPKVMSFKMIKV